MGRLQDIIVAFVLVALVALLDIVVVGFILNPAGITNQYVPIWQIAMFFIFVPILALVFLGMGKPVITLWFVGLIIGGWEDALYFWLQGQGVPDALPWHPLYQTSGALYIAMAVSVAILYFITRRMR